ncbi:flagellar rod assembly protein/muramidase FlgJ [Solemya pervernicosa gill symbiont]|uniref:Peptidoglycan hydrolase FlgJ n=1 Tax=Solemya pervernicosa gill symbiont TaxID=642797 RepID=A0A1T2L8Z5_9GAMM|nr:flagellar assembly peptidoglycan hydrolase FlgJ [Solemya pervernicosa gill symbiont]OOZ41504.1 flagellar rod assembly protein/muramidase FlgJ [Solemya pervernicosa gill symbiont]
MNELSNASTYTDFQGLAGLKQQARSESPEAIREVARQFEAMFTQMMLKSMREASLSEGLMDSDQSKLYQSMYDQQISLNMSEGRGLGFTDLLVEQLGGAPRSTASNSGEPREFKLPARSTIDQVRAMAPRPLVVENPSVDSQPMTAASQSGNSGKVMPVEIDRFENPQQFVTALWPHAQQAAEKLGTKPEVLIAQAALETGWGSAITRDEQGNSSRNLFNIKADSRWNGDSAEVSTIEYRDGVALRERASFRAYDGYSDSFNDYVDFLSANPRYQKALEMADNPERYTEELQKAGYATDPNYADKINRIMNGEILGSVTPELRNAGQGASV